VKYKNNEPIETETNEYEDKTIYHDDETCYTIKSYKNKELISIDEYDDNIGDRLFEVNGDDCHLIVPHAIDHIRESIFHKDKNMTEEKRYDGNGHLIWTTQFVNDNSGCLIEINTYDKKGMLFCKEIRQYDDRPVEDKQTWEHLVSSRTWVHKKYVDKVFDDNNKAFSGLRYNIYPW